MASTKNWSRSKRMIDPQREITPQQVADNYAEVLADVAEACRRADRDANDVTVVGVSKYVDTATTAMLVRAGCRDLGENRPQMLWKKADSGEIDSDVQWHLIGHLQRNKANRLLRRDVLIHSVDSRRVLDAIVEASADKPRPTRVMLELNVSGDLSKTGMEPSLIESILLTECEHPSPGVEIVGLMAMAGWGTDDAQSRRQFSRVREFRDLMQQRLGMALPELSMGMSGDFSSAIAEGATMVRIGSRLFS